MNTSYNVGPTTNNPIFLESICYLIDKSKDETYKNSKKM